MAATTKPHYTRPDRSHGGSSQGEIQDEPDWVQTHTHRIGFRDINDRHTGLTHAGDDWNTEQQRQFLIQAKEEAEELGTELKDKKLVDVREFMTKQEVRFRIFAESPVHSLHDCLIHSSRTIT